MNGGRCSSSILPPKTPSLPQRSALGSQLSRLSALSSKPSALSLQLSASVLKALGSQLSASGALSLGGSQPLGDEGDGDAAVDRRRCPLVGTRRLGICAPHSHPRVVLSKQRKRVDPRTKAEEEDFAEAYDVIIVGSGNGACGYLTEFCRTPHFAFYMGPRSYSSCSGNFPVMFREMLLYLTLVPEQASPEVWVPCRTPKLAFYTSVSYLAPLLGLLTELDQILHDPKQSSLFHRQEYCSCSRLRRRLFHHRFSKKNNPPEFITAIVKFNAAKSGRYHKDKEITLGWFESPQDKAIAEAAIVDNLPLMRRLGTEISGPLKFIFQGLTKIPFDASDVPSYVDHYSRNTLLSEQHMSGGCLFGDALDLGLQDSSHTGKVRGTTNVHVADLSSLPLPRVSPQMTAYLVGFHVAHQLYAAAIPCK